jgi:phosphoglycerate dehydrogenase-like enzyme
VTVPTPAGEADMRPIEVAADQSYREWLSPLPGGVHVAWFEALDEAKRAAAHAEVLALGPDRGWGVDGVIAVAPQLRWVHTRAAGVDRGQLNSLRQHRDRCITLTNGSGVSSIPIAEYVVMALLATAKGLPGLLAAQTHARWEKPAGAREIHGSTALLLGFGAVGRAVWDRLRPFGVRCTAVRRSPVAGSAPDGTDGTDGEVPGIEIIGPDAWRARLHEFDWIIVTIPLTDETRQLIGWREFAAMHAEAWLVNVSRGGVVDQAALTTALQWRAIGGAVLDVTDPEPLPPEHELWSAPNVVITPHCSWMSPTFAERAGGLLLENLRRWRAGEPLRNVVDLDAGY